MDIQIQPTVKQLIERARCMLRGRTLSGHDWKRAVRFLGNSGTQTCRRCGAKRDVTLRPRRDLAPTAGA